MKPIFATFAIQNQNAAVYARVLTVPRRITAAAGLTPLIKTWSIMSTTPEIVVKPRVTAGPAIAGNTTAAVADMNVAIRSRVRKYLKV